MRFKLLIAFALLAVFAVGFFLGHYDAPRIYQSRYDFARDVHSSYDIRCYIHALNLLHDERQADAIAYLNSNLEDSLNFPLGNYVRNREHTHPEILAALKEARDFRKKYPPQPRPAFRGGQEEILFSIK
jgi:hypothetical protein